jgi:hypothetical protein
MAKLTISDITSGYTSTTALNTAFAAIETALENTLSRDGTSPNQMSANLDLNGYAILNARATSGDENFIWMGTWVTGTTYAVNNLVYAPEGANEGATLICVTAHTAGATLDGDAANWAVFAQRGATGAGTGDVIGPASATADSLARFNGTTGKLLKDGAVVGTDVQAYDAALASYAANTLTAANKIPYATALDTASELDFIDDDTMATASATAIASSESVVAYVGTEVAATKPLVVGTAQSTTSGTAITFSSLPAGISRIQIALNSVSFSTTGQEILVRLGTAGGTEITGYVGSAGNRASEQSMSDGFIITRGLGSIALAGSLVTLVHIGSNIWVASGTTGYSNATAPTFFAGVKPLSGELDRLVITTTSATQVFDNGSINILYE